MVEETLEVFALISSEDDDIELIFAQGTPLKEPIAWRGPIVMNTQKELMEAFRALENNTFI